MNYTQEEYEALVKAVEVDGGEVLDELCGVREYEFTGDEKRMDKYKFLPGCGNTGVICEIPYDSGNGILPIKLCAVCDDLGATPRYRKAVLG